MSLARRGLLVAAALALLTAVVANSWLDQRLTTSLLLGATVSGLATGSIFAIAASGLVITYVTSGVFNVAHGAVGMFMAFLYWELKVNRGLPTPLCLVLVLGVAAPALGIVLDILMMGRLRDASVPQQLVATVGVMLALMGL